MTALDKMNIIEICKKLLDECNPNISPELVVQQLNDLNDLTKSEKKQICEIIYGCSDNRRVLNVVVDGYYLKNGKNCSLTEKNLYHVIGYIIIYKVHQLGLNELTILKKYPHAEKLFKFLKYFLNDKNILTWMKDAWCLQFEAAYVETQLLNPLLAILPDLLTFQQQLEEKIYNFEVKKNPNPTTTIQNFNLTQQTRKKILLPEQIPTKSITTTGLYTRSITELNNKPLIQVRNKAPIPPRTIKSSPIKDHLRNNISKPFKAKDFNPSQNDTEPIKLNTAVILKDEFLIRKQADDVLRKFAYLDAGEGSAEEFVKWQSKMRLEDEARKLEQIVLNKIQSKLAYEEAILAKNNLVLSNKKKVAKIQQDNQQLDLLIQEKKRNEAVKRTLLVEKTLVDESKVKATKLKVEKDKRLIVQNMIRESEELEKVALKQMEIDMKRKLELIQQIKAADSMPINKTKLVDLTSNSGHRLLSEMSIAELKERLELLRQQNDEQNKRKHDDIVSTKIKKDQVLIDKLHYINKFRNENTNLAEEKMMLIKQAPTGLDQEVDSVVKLKKKLDETRMERVSVAASRSMRVKDKQYNIYQSQRKTLEQNRFKDLESTHERLRMVAQ